jgi:tetratricopeptide (TPR) repeat protein
VSFELTTRSLFELPTIQREYTLANLLSQYHHQHMEEKRLSEHGLLMQAWAILQQRLEQHPLNEEVVHLGVSLCHTLKEREVPLLFLSRYLRQPLTLLEEAWAKWHLVDHLALAGRCEETITTQQDLLRWALLHFPVRDVLWVMNDATQALCWTRKEQGAQWMHIFSDLLEQAETTEKNRHDRFCYLRTAGIVCGQLKNADETLALAKEIHQLAQEDLSWEHNLEAHTEAFHLEIRANHQLQRIEEMRTLAITTAKLLEEAYQTFVSEVDISKDFWVRYHNLGAQLYFAGQYDLAISQFRRVLDLSGGSAHTYLWLAASLWATVKDRDEVLSLLASATHLYAGGQPWDYYRELPEFEDVCYDSQIFQAAHGLHDK